MKHIANFKECLFKVAFNFYSHLKKIEFLYKKNKKKNKIQKLHAAMHVDLNVKQRADLFMISKQK